MVDVWQDAPDVATHYKPSNGCFYIVKPNGVVYVLGKRRTWKISEHSAQDVATGDFIQRPDGIAQKSADVALQSRPDGITQLPTANKYDRVIHGKYGTGKCTVDVYRVLNAFGPLSPEIDHAVKKLLTPGTRGHKGEKQDLLEAIQSIEARLQYLEAVNG